MSMEKTKTTKDHVNDAIQILRGVSSGLQGEFTLEHLHAAEPLVDRFECLKWAVENQATVKEMLAWHRAQNMLDLFSDKLALAPTAPQKTGLSQ